MLDFVTTCTCMSAHGAPADERAAGPQARAVEVICRWSALSRTLRPPGPRQRCGAAEGWPGEARPRSRSGRRGVERCFWRRSPRVLARRWRHVTSLAGGGYRWSRGRFQPEKASHAAAGAGFWSRKGSCRIGSLRGVTGSRLVTCRILSASFRVAHGSRIPLDVTASQPSRKSCFWVRSPIA